MINGDKKLSIFEHFVYFIQCIIEHRKSSNYDLKLLHPKLSIKGLENKIGSPSRILCNAFWNSINYKKKRWQYVKM